MPMPLAPRSPRPRMRSPVVTTMKRTSRSGQLRRISRTPDDVPELLASLADRRRVHEGKEPRRVGHEQAVEERLVGVLQRREVDVALQVRGLRVQLRERAPRLGLEIVN